MPGFVQRCQRWLQAIAIAGARLGLAFALVFSLGITPMLLPARASLTLPLRGESTSLDWSHASAEEKLAYCRKAYKAFRASPSQSYIISSNVQTLEPEGFCHRLDQFYSFDIHADTRLDGAAAIAPLLFADLPLE